MGIKQYMKLNACYKFVPMSILISTISQEWKWTLERIPSKLVEKVGYPYLHISSKRGLSSLNSDKVGLSPSI